ncbi:MAG: TIGR01212 family radical SAM protein [Ruminococcus sp.]|nr:TIGR01212 family radical SAM protein [Ruminococcus sp.]
MENPFPYSDSNKRYLTQSYYLKKRFGKKVMKISLNCGFTCPNIDGSKGRGGCTFCLSGSGEFGGERGKTVTEQFYEVRERMNRKWSEGLYIPYFQANTNTYAPAETLRRLYEEALGLPDVAGLAVSTRPDCVPDDVLDLLTEIAQRTYLTVELGLQTVHDETARRLNRCHGYADFVRCTERLNSRGINVCAHIINGLPGKDLSMMLRTAETLAGLPLHQVKIHLLHILRGTRLADDYLRGAFTLPTLEEYARIVCAQLEVLPPDVIIGRITGDGGRESLIAPLWSLKKFTVMNEIDKLLARENRWQGRLYS